MAKKYVFVRAISWFFASFPFSSSDDARRLESNVSIRIIDVQKMRQVRWIRATEKSEEWMNDKEKKAIRARSSSLDVYCEQCVMD